MAGEWSEGSSDVPIKCHEKFIWHNKEGKQKLVWEKYKVKEVEKGMKLNII